MPDDKTKKETLNQIRYRLHHTTADLDVSLEIFGDELAKTKGYRDFDGIEAVRFYLMQKHHWTPAQVRSLSNEDLRFAVSAEMAGFSWPKEVQAELKDHRHR